MRYRLRRLLQSSVEATGACPPMVRVGVLCAVGFAAALFAGCGELEPMREPEVVDLELTTDTLKLSVRDAQRTVGELRADLEARRGELAEAQVAQAQLEGRVREAERRVIEARHVIELQREELAAARTERARVSRSSLQLQGQMKQLRKQLSKMGAPHDEMSRRRPPCRPAERCARARRPCRLPHSEISPQNFRRRLRRRRPCAVVQVPTDRKPSSGVEQQMASTKHISVKSGDTLWSIAQRYRVRLEYLRTLNQLTDNRIEIGQALWLPDGRPMYGVGAEKGPSTR